MFTTYAVVTLLTAAANAFSATLDFIRYEQVLINMAKARVSESWISTLGVLKATGALGLVVGFGVPLIGTVAAAGLTLFFVGAIITHLRARDYSFGLAVVFLALAVGTLVLGVHVRGSEALATLPRMGLAGEVR
jgi:hypothetical protein